MNPAQHEKLSRLLIGLQETPPDEIDEFVEAACSNDEELGRELKEILAYMSPSRRESSDSDAIPSQIGPYQIKRRLGRGGMGTVYEAIQTRTGRPVALKVPRRHESSMKRFEAEIQLLGKLKHPRIAQIYHAGVAATKAGDQPFFVMELVRGDTLDVYMNKAALGDKQRIELFLQVCDAIEHAHERGVLHRDLSPKNIIVDPRGNPKVLDFGIATTGDADPDAGRVQPDAAASTGLFGTLGYSSLDRVQDQRSDVYSLGVLLHDLVVSVPTQSDYRMGSSARRWLRNEMKAIAEKATSKEPDRRYGSVAELIHAVRSTKSAARTRKRTRRARILLASTALLGAFAFYEVMHERGSVRALADEVLDRRDATRAMADEVIDLRDETRALADERDSAVQELQATLAQLSIAHAKLENKKEILQRKKGIAQREKSLNHQLEQTNQQLEQANYQLAQTNQQLEQANYLLEQTNLRLEMELAALRAQLEGGPGLALGHHPADPHVCPSKEECGKNRPPSNNALAQLESDDH